jgi:hypothetical protein
MDFALGEPCHNSDMVVGMFLITIAAVPAACLDRAMVGARPAGR